MSDEQQSWTTSKRKTYSFHEQKAICYEDHDPLSVLPSTALILGNQFTMKTRRGARTDCSWVVLGGGCWWWLIGP